MGLDPVMVLAGAAGVTVVLIFWAVVSAVESRKKRAFAQRMARAQRQTVQSGSGGDQAQKLRREQISHSPFMDKLVGRYMPRPALLKQRLEQAGLNFSLGDYVLFSICIAVVFGVLGVLLFGLSVAVAVLVGLSAGFALPHLLVGFLIKRRLKLFTSEFPEAIDLIVRGLKSGLPVTGSFRTVSEEMRPPLATEFSVISDRIRVGQNMDEAMALSAERVPTPEFKFFVISLAVQRETGGNLAETLENLSDVLRKRRQMRQKIKAMSSEAKASAIILGSLPFLMYGIMEMLNHAYVGTLFSDPRGMVMVGFGLASLMTGILVMAKMVRFEI